MPRCSRSFNRLKDSGKNWVDKLPSVLWFIHTTAIKPMGETPFALVYGAEAVLPIEVKHRSPRVLAFNEEAQEDIHYDDL